MIVTAGSQPQPDLLIKQDSEPDSAFAINDVYQTTPSGDQIETQSVPLSQTATYQVKVENDGTEARTFELLARESSESDWTVTYKVGSTDITDDITSFGYITSTLAPGGSEILTIEMTPPGSAISSISKSTTIEAFLGKEDETVRDAVQAVTTVGGELIVNSTGDAIDKDESDGVCDTGNRTPKGEPECTLRAAIQEANATGQDIIFFDIPDQDVPTIQPQSALPTITDPVVINAATQPGGMVILDGSEAPGFVDGLSVNAKVSTVRSLRIQNFGRAGIQTAAENEEVFLEAIEVLDNCDWGILAEQTVWIEQWAKVNNNGRREGCEGGGILSRRGSILAEGVKFIEVMDNRRDGLLTLAADSVITLTNARIANNRRDGIVLNGADTLLQIFGTQNEVSGNRWSGISNISGGGITIEGIEIRDNKCGWGITTNGDVRIEQSATVEKNNQGEDCKGGGIAGNDLRVDNTVVKQNRGDGIRAEILSAGNLTVRENAGNGIVAPDIVIEEGLVCGNGGQEIKGCNVQCELPPEVTVSEECPSGQ